MKDKILNALQAANSLLEEFLSDNRNIETIETFAQVIANVFENGNKIIIAGNGGSAADAMHFAEEFTGKFRKERKALPVIAIPDSSHITCVSNDFGFDHIF
ncbi:MAG: SIS domain-containing protein, partial [Candidatus Cloacimonadota bacterium]|nr:SIS domain-containing protein [Candidatus Cloacimonadota bacterium]